MEGYQPTKKEEDNAESFMTATQQRMSEARKYFLEAAAKLNIDPNTLDIDSLEYQPNTDRGLQLSAVIKGHKIDITRVHIEDKKDPNKFSVSGEIDGIPLTQEQATAVFEKIGSFVYNADLLRDFRKMPDEIIQKEIKQMIEKEQEEAKPKIVKDVLKDLFNIEV